MSLSVVIWVMGKCVRDGCPGRSQRSTKKQRVACALTFLMRYHKERDGTLSHIVTGDETWVSQITPESKQQSLHWKHTGSPERKRFKQTFPTWKITCTVFWDRQDVLFGRMSNIVTGDETWVSKITPESKQQSLHWKHTGSPERKTFKQTFPTR